MDEHERRRGCVTELDVKTCTSAAAPLRGLHEKYLPLSRHASALFMVPTLSH